MQTQPSVEVVIVLRIEQIIYSMESTNSLPKQQSTDGKGAFAGSPEPNPEQDTVDAVAAKVGVDLAPGQPTDIKRILDERDENRWELDPESARNSRPRS